MEFTQVIQERYACKKFDGRPVESAQLEAILEAGRLAPTAKIAVRTFFHSFIAISGHFHSAFLTL
jgi:hypothetical protein